MPVAGQSRSDPPRRKPAAGARAPKAAPRAAAGFAAGAVAVFALFIGNVPLPAALPAAQSSTVLSADGSVLALFHGTEDRVIVPLNQISTNLRQAVVAAEDRNFYSNSGVSL